MRLFTVKDFLEIISFVHEIFVDRFEFLDLSHPIELTVNVGPGAVRDPVGGVGEYLDLTSRSGK
jgi:hypothetical protein